MIIIDTDHGFELKNPVTWSTERTWGAGQSPMRECCYSPDGQLFASAHDNGALTLWDMHNFWYRRLYD